MKCFIDFESDGLSPYTAQIITGYFLLETGECYDFKSQINGWSDSAELIHKITYQETLLYPDKKTAFENLLEWLPSEFEIICFANPQSQFGYMLYDEVVLKMNLMDHLNIDRFEHLPFKSSSYSVHSMAKKAHKLGLFEPERNSETNRLSFRQEAIYTALFNEKYDAHNAKQDTLAMKRIYDKLNELLISGESLIEKNQMSLF